MKYKLGLVKGRHELPVTSYVFDEIKDVTNVALVTVMNVCFDLNIHLTLFHFDNVTGKYFSQETRNQNDVSLF